MMYTLQSFKITDPQILQTVMLENPFAILVAGLGGTSPQFSHLPLLWEKTDEGQGRLLCHMARANPQWRLFQTHPSVVAIFSGPHAYVTPRWYEDQTSVPTWNYVAVHAQGQANLVQNDSDVFVLMQKLVSHFESQKPEPWSIESAMPNWDEDVRAIVGIEIQIESLDGKFKLSQNRNATDRQQVTKNFSESSVERERELGRWMRSVKSD